MQRLTSLEQWKQWREEYRMLPFIIKYDLPDLSRVETWELAWEHAAETSFVLESGKTGRYTFLGLQSVSTIRGVGEDAVISKLCDGDTLEQEVHGKPLSLVKSWMEPFTTPKVDGAPKFTGGCVGFWGYDVVRTIEELPKRADADLINEIPDFCFMRIEELWIIDHEENTLYTAIHVPVDEDLSLEELYAQTERRARNMKALWDRFTHLGGTEAGAKSNLMKHYYESDPQADHQHIDIESIVGLSQPFSKLKFINAVTAIQNYIRQGDVFQVNLSVRQSRKCETSPDDIYEWLRLFNPSPYMGLLRFQDFKLVSGSPELLVKLEGDEVETRPIAGTRHRGSSPQEDRQLADELIENEKERAEHVMLVDLLRNDLGRISTFGTVKVHDFMEIEYYSHVMHIVSGIKGRLAKKKDAYDVIEAVFPGGTITGAPKIRTMEIIEELEPTRRGPYTGAMGWIDYTGNMEFNIIIRTLTMKDGTGHIQAGAGIVIDSEPEKEYIESLNKAKALWKAIQYSEAFQNQPK